MRVSLKSKLTALISFIVLLVVLATSTLYISSLTRQTLTEIKARGEYIASEIYNQARSVLAESRMPPGTNPDDPLALRQFVQEKLAADPGLTSLMESAVGYSPTILYVAITDSDSVALIHTDPEQAGHHMTSAPSYDELRSAGLFRQMRAIYGPALNYEVLLPLDIGGRPLAVRVGISTLFIRDQITPDLRRALLIALLAVLLATATAAVVSYRVLRPLETISRSVDRMARGEFSEALRLKRKDEWGILSSKLNLLGEQLRGEKTAFVALQENLDHLFSKLAEGLMLFDRHDHLVVATPAVARFLHRPAEAMVHHTASEIFSTRHPLDIYLGELFRRRESRAGEVIELPCEGEPQHTEVSVQFAEEQGEPVASLVTFRDATSRARLEDQLDVTTKMAALGRITSGVAHEVKNPLNAMVLALEILKAKLEGQNEGVQPQLQILSEEIRRLDRVVKTFLDFTRPVELRRAPTDLAGLVTEVVNLAEPMARQNNVRMILLANGALPLISLDRDLIKQALLNLVLNGCQAMPSGGELRLSSRISPQNVTLEIADQGGGIPAEIRNKIFSLYFTTKPGGTGVGLAMAYRIIELHNGKIDYSSEVNRGTTFRIVLPR